MYKLLVIIIVFLLGLYFIYRSKDTEMFTCGSRGGNSGNSGNSGYDVSGNSKMTPNCPDVLIQKGSALFLYNTKRASVPGVNPIRFKNLEEYIEFTEWQRSQGILCPILYLKHAYNAQGEPVYKAHPSPTNLHGGLPDYYINQAILPDQNFNPNIMPPPASVPVRGFLPVQGFGGQDKTGSPILEIPPVDMSKIQEYPSYNSEQCNEDVPLDNLYHNGVSPTPMDANWGGIEYTDKLVEAGYYKGNEVSLRV